MDAALIEIIRGLFGWCNNKDVLSTLEAIQKTAFYHDEDTDMLKLGCT